MKKQTVIRTVLAVGTISMGLPVAQAQTSIYSTAASSTWNSTTVAGNPPFWTSSFSTANDVLLGLTPTSSAGDFTAGSSANRASVTDGSLIPVTTSNPSNLSSFQGVGAGAGTELVYTLSQAAQLSSIQYYGGWADAGRSSINFNVAYSTDNGATYTTLWDTSGGYYITYGDTPDTQTSGLSNSGNTYARQIGGAGPVTTYVDVTDASGDLAGGALITNLKFDFGSIPGGNGWSGLEQLVATAVPVPEPSAYLMLGGGLLSLMALRKRTAA